ncbi:putative lipoyltransferase 2, mitochondrial [Ceratina calcarata]|uniref:Octanoyl-[acyl-carrier-protein]:protein N-octanoyltransferase LIPT2, mitochondrial n=1 Tax=Ceratina calcarata TaxID=156304 RepID=A0AAJ7J2N0_9HYME|nr:putative lipoyltransferase 2, mitochondrial [Ceratina calcarata]XP_017882988.1 putative lipoyltransferase 2, mitochondrial [Ceratina calcarata]XP_026670773.1 putative lipoyltransferase 2, mitochondrial [Ceratina calcarata]XP_026670781.1 putative lipoyltransferase 2, mitochondrial [Ceratina calcarata]
MSKNVVKVLSAGRISYQTGLHLQTILSNRHRIDKQNPSSNDTNRDSLILLEHDPVYTIGIRDHTYSDSEISELKSLGAEFYRTNRGGLITFHGPGQLTGYPILNLKNFVKNGSMKWYVGQLESMIIRVCAELGLKGQTDSINNGVWVRGKKICAVGVHGKRYVTSHGFALNCNTDLRWFDHIVPCGLQGKCVTSLSTELDINVNVNDVLPLVRTAFQDQFQCELIDFTTEEQYKLWNDCISTRSCQ